MRVLQWLNKRWWKSWGVGVVDPPYDEGLSHNRISLRTAQSHLVKRPVAVSDPKTGTPPIRDRIQHPNHRMDLPVTGQRPDHFANPSATPSSCKRKEHRHVGGTKSSLKQFT